MVTLTCKLTFADRRSVTGVVVASSPQGERQVIYTGAVDRLPRRFEMASPSFLAVLFKNIARETGATFSKRLTGVYDFHAE